MTSRNYCFTYHLNGRENIDFVLNPAMKDKIKYLVYQLERCPTTMRNHAQGYVEFKESVRIPGAKRILGLVGVHLEPRKGTREQAREYCMKTDSRIAGPYEFGDWEVQQGYR